MSAPDRDAVPAGLTIGELARRTSVPVATLRTWESRYGAPRPRRLDGGHRRYDESEVALVAEIVRLRDAGLALPTAVEQATAAQQQPASSLFARIREQFPGVRPQPMSKRTLLAVTRAIEDECCAQAPSPVVYAGFQREEFYWSSQPRWAELARTAASAVVFADFAGPSAGDDRPVRLRLPDDAPLRREWFVVCDSAQRPACLTGWELPGQDGVPDAERRFEAMVSVEPRVVREAARVCASAAAPLWPGAGGPAEASAGGSPREASPDLANAQRLLERVVAYLDARP